MKMCLISIEQRVIEILGRVLLLDFAGGEEKLTFL